MTDTLAEAVGTDGTVPQSRYTVPTATLPPLVAVVTLHLGTGPGGCHDNWCIAAPHPGQPLHVDCQGVTWTDYERRLRSYPHHGEDDDPDAAWERHQDEGTWPAGYDPD